MTLTEFAGLIAPLGSLFVAAAVYANARAQARWSTAVTIRSARVEEQNLRLALLDERRAALEAIRGAISNFWRDGAVSQADVGAVARALQAAELVFEDDQRRAINELLVQLWKWQSLHRKMDAFRDEPNSRDKYLAAVNESAELETVLTDTSFRDVITSLIEATRIRSVPPVALPQSRLKVVQEWLKARK